MPSPLRACPFSPLPHQTIARAPDSARADRATFLATRVPRAGLPTPLFLTAAVARACRLFSIAPSLDSLPIFLAPTAPTTHYLHLTSHHRFHHHTTSGHPAPPHVNPTYHLHTLHMLPCHPTPATATHTHLPRLHTAGHYTRYTLPDLAYLHTRISATT